MLQSDGCARPGRHPLSLDRLGSWHYHLHRHGSLAIGPGLEEAASAAINCTHNMYNWQLMLYIQTFSIFNWQWHGGREARGDG